MWLERLVSLLKEEGKTNLPKLYDMDFYMLSAAAIKSVFHPIMEDIQIYRDINLDESIPRGMNVRENYWWNNSFQIGVENQALDNGVKETVINFTHRWSEYEVSKGKHPGFNILEHYAAGANTR